MLETFFQTTAIPQDSFLGIYNPYLVALSYIVSVCASYIALDFAGQLRSMNITKSPKWIWLIGGSIAMGAGIWSMHFIGMLSFSIPGLNLQYDLFWTGFSLFIAIIASGFALYLLQTKVTRVEHYIAGGFVLGIGIASMHYTGMEALFISLNIRYLPFLFLLSIVIAIVASLAAIWLSIKSSKVILRQQLRIKIVSSLIMGLAICGMHYTGMAASVFTPLCGVSFAGPGGGSGVDQTYLSIAVAGATFAILGVALFASIYKDSLNQGLIEQARQIGMAEISTGVLHNVGNILNSVNVSINTIAEQTYASKLDRLGKICAILNEHSDNLDTFLTQDPRGIKTLEFLNVLAKCWEEEQANTLSEIDTLKKNIELIQNTISTQQNLSKTTSLEVNASINDLLDEALLITGLDNQNEIAIEKHYGKIKVIKIDSINFIQILINLLSNAKDAVMESSKTEKKIMIKTSVSTKNTIEIIDNGIGIQSQNLKKIFTYGFTTKKTGHGFGLHTSAITLKNLGGNIEVFSDGVEQGTRFILEI